jgi:hypothetical protein
LIAACRSRLKSAARSPWLSKSYLACVQENTGLQIARGEKSVDKIDGSVMSACEPLVRNFQDAETQCVWAGSYVPGKGLKLNRRQSQTIALNTALHVKMKALGEMRKQEKAAGLKI